MGKSTLKVKNDPTNDEKKNAQNLAIKRRLSKYYQSMEQHIRPSIYALQAALANMPDGFTVSYNTLNELLSEVEPDTIPTPNLYLVLALCRYWNLDYATIFAPPESQIKPVPSATALVEKSKVLDDPGYHGTFHGYLYTKNITKQEIVPFELIIEPQAGSVIAKMTTRGKQENVNGEELSNVTTYTGTPILLTKTETVFMILSNPDGLSYILYFDYRHYNIAKLYYRKGIALTTESASDKPVLGNFVLFQNTVSQRKLKKYVPGLLSIIGDYFIITDEAMQELEQDPEMAAFFRDYGYNWREKTISGYRVIFEHVLSSIDDQYNDAEVLRVMGALLRMTEKSQSPNRIEYDNPPGMPKFAKIYLQNKDE